MVIPQRYLGASKGIGYRALGAITAPSGFAVEAKFHAILAFFGWYVLESKCFLAYY